VPADPWGHPYVYKVPGDHTPYEIDSYGAGGIGSQSLIKSASQ
jgi:general secretion pathway protein G